MVFLLNSCFLVDLKRPVEIQVNQRTCLHLLLFRRFARKNPLWSSVHFWSLFQLHSAREQHVPCCNFNLRSEQGAGQWQVSYILLHRLNRAEASPVLPSCRWRGKLRQRIWNFGGRTMYRHRCLPTALPPARAGVCLQRSTANAATDQLTILTQADWCACAQSGRRRAGACRQRVQATEETMNSTPTPDSPTHPRKFPQQIGSL